MSARPKVGLFVTCLVDLIRPQVGFAAVRLLEEAGCDVIVPREQTCCGQPAWNSGADQHAVAIARQVIDQFEVFDYVVAPSGSCAGMLRRHYPEVLKTDPNYAQRAIALSRKSHELMSFLVRKRGKSAVNSKWSAKVCYHDSCSALREMGTKSEARQLLATVGGLSLQELRDPQICCGFGGLFSVKYPEISERMGDDKIADAEATGADTLVGPDLGCLLHLAGRIKRRGVALKVRHAAEILAGMNDEPAIGEPES